MRPDPIAALAESWGEMFKQSQIQGGYRKMRRASGVADSVHDNLAQIAAAKRRVRRAAKRAADERRTAEGRATYTPPAKLGFQRTGWFTGWAVRLAQWDGAPYAMEWPRWRIRSRERRARSVVALGGAS